jgi:type I restriction enzyme S subunit
MNPYSDYKPSGVEWIGEIPRHWKRTKIKHEFVFSGGGTPSTENDEYWGGNIPWISSKDMKSKYLTESTDYITELGLRNSPCSMVEPNCMIMVVRSGILQRTIPVSINLVPLVVNQDQKVFKTKGRVRVDYFYYFVTGNERHLLVDWMKEGTTVESIELEYLYRFHLNVPPLPEQEEIVRYLDTKTQEIDQLVSITQKKIDLLKERRTSTINEVVTKGLNTNVELKDSGLEWIGEIPRHWERRKVSTLGTFFKGSGIKKDEVREVGFPCIRYGEIYTQYERVLVNTVSFIDEETTKSSVLIGKGDVLFTGSGETVEDIGKSVVYFGEEEVYVSGDIIVLRLSGNEVDPLFMSYLMNTDYVNHQKSLSARGEIIVHIYSKNIREIQVFLPPLPEQEEIVRYLDTKTKEIDQLVSIEENRIETLKEYRQTLISEVVTGKVKVTSTEPIHEEG